MIIFSSSMVNCWKLDGDNISYLQFKGGVTQMHLSKNLGYYVRRMILHVHIN